MFPRPKIRVLEVEADEAAVPLVGVEGREEVRTDPTSAVEDGRGLGAQAAVAAVEGNPPLVSVDGEAEARLEETGGAVAGAAV